MQETPSQMLWLIMVPAVVLGVSIFWLFLKMIRAVGNTWPWKAIRLPYVVAVIAASVAFAVVAWYTTVPEAWRLPFWLAWTLIFALIMLASTYGYWRLLSRKANS
jgi:hypothetical protein